MKSATAKIAFLVAAGCLFAASAHALDGKLVLDQLVKKGVLTQQESDAIVAADAEKQKAAGPALAPVLTKTADTTSIRITGGVQTQVKYTTHRNVGGVNTNITPGSGFELRRFQLGAEGRIGAWTVFGQIEGDGGNNGVNSNGNVPAGTVGPNGQNGVQLTNGSRYDIIIDKAGVAYDTGDYGAFMAGVDKSRFSAEEYQSSFELYTIERSPVSFYFGSYYETGANGTNTGLTGNATVGGRKIGLYYDKPAGRQGGFTWGAAVTNAYAESYTSKTNPTQENYCPEFFANVGYVYKPAADTELSSGFNFAYTEANSGQISDGTNGAATTYATNGSSIANNSRLIGNTATNADFDTTTAAVEWITKFKYGRLTLIGDVMAAYIRNGRYETGYAAGHADNAMPLGVTGLVAYRVTESIEPIVQFAYLETDGRGVTEGGVVRDYNNTTGTAYDRCYNVFAGVNWYITPRSLKFTAGFEGTQFEGLAHGASLPAGATSSVRDYGVRMQLQARF